MVFYDDKCVEIKWDEVNRVVISTYKGYMSSEQFRAVSGEVLECLIKYKANKVIYDMRNFMTLRPEDQEWSMNEYANNIFKAVGKVKNALVMPGNMIQKKVIDKMASSDKLGNQTTYVESVEEGLAWLRK